MSLLCLACLCSHPISSGQHHNGTHQHSISLEGSSLPEVEIIKNHHHPEEHVFEHTYNHAYIKTNVQPINKKNQREIHFEGSMDNNLTTRVTVLANLQNGLILKYSIHLRKSKNRGPPYQLMTL
ncbi:MAG: hypothetical protein ABUK01_18415 [Leptospirales bacterium]